MCWAAEHWDDVLSDMSVFHRLDEHKIDGLTARQFWPRVRRLIHYNGAVLGVAMAEARETTPQTEGKIEAPQAPPAEEPVPQDPTPEQIRVMRDAARRRRYPAAQYGETRYVSDQEIVRKAGTSA